MGGEGSRLAAALRDARRQWRRQARSARARIAAPGADPLTRRNGDVVIGGLIRAIRHPAPSMTALPYDRLRSHQVVIGMTGTGSLSRSTKGRLDPAFTECPYALTPCTVIAGSGVVTLM